MKRKLVWSERARQDLFAIGDHIAQDRPAAARKHVEKLRRRARQAARFPGSGRVVPELPELGDGTVREFIEANYRIVYRVTKSAILVLTVFEAHRLAVFDPELEED